MYLHERRSGPMGQCAGLWIERSVFEPQLSTSLCPWARHFTLIVPFFSQVYKWVLVNLLLGVTL